MHWVSLPVLRFGQGYLQVLADPGGDRRLLVSYDRSGRKMETRTLNAALGFLAVAARTRLAVAMRTLNHRELVVYRWAWTDPALNDARPTCAIDQRR